MRSATQFTLLRITSAILLLGLAVSSCSSGDLTGNSGFRITENTTDMDDPKFGVLVMAHGGSEQWNVAVEQSAAPLSADYPMVIAFGMADAGRMEQAVRELEAQGVEHVGVVRLFISGESWFERTQQILGMETGAPDKATVQQTTQSQRPSGMRMGFWKIDTDLAFHMHDDGLADAEQADEVLLSRIAQLSEDPSNEVVVVLAHGTEDDSANQGWEAKIRERTALAESQLGLNEVQVFTLREDWQAKREQAEHRIRDYIQTATDAGQTVIVVPYRVHGFGPYRQVLAGLDYVADELGLVPHEKVTEWMAARAERLHHEATIHHHELVGAGN